MTPRTNARPKAARKARRALPPKPGRLYRQIWRLVDGALRDAVTQHPDYFTPAGLRHRARVSLTKRVAGAIHGYAEQSAQGRSGAVPRGGPAADTGAGEGTSPGALRGRCTAAAAAGPGVVAVRPREAGQAKSATQEG